MARRITILLGHDACAGWRDGGAIGPVARDLPDATPPGQEARLFGPAAAVALRAGPGFVAVMPSWRERWRRPKAACRTALIGALRRFAPAVSEVHDRRVLPERLARALPRARRLRRDGGQAVGVRPRFPARASSPSCTARPCSPWRSAWAGWRRWSVPSARPRPWRHSPSPAEDAPAEGVRAGAAAWVEVPGQPPDAELLSLMAPARIVVVPGRLARPLPRVAQAALAAATAPVASRLGGIPEASGDVALQAGPERPGQIAAAVPRLAAAAKECRAGMTERGRRHLQRVAIRETMRRWTALRCG